MAELAAEPVAAPTLDGATKKQISEGRAHHASFKPTWAEALAFLENRQFVYRMANAKRIDELETREGGSKPRYRARTTRNIYTKNILAEVSAGVQRVPGYDVKPTTTDPEDVSAARLNEKILLDLYERLSLREHLTIARIYSVTCGEGFVRPYWNKGAGAELPAGEDGEQLFEGEISLETYGPDEVFWKKGHRFKRSPWLCIDRAMSIDEVKELPGYNGAEIKPDTKASANLVAGQLARDTARADAVMVTEFLELPSGKYPKGRRLFVANDTVVCTPEDYPDPVRTSQGYEHCVHVLPYIPTPHRDRDLGLGTLMVDPQRTINDVANKAIQWKNLAIRPQMMAPQGSILTRITDEDGLIITYRPVMGLKPEWQQVPPIPPSLFQMKDDAKADMQEIASQHALPPGVESGRGIEAVYERDQSVTAFIIQSLADFHARLGRHLLTLAQKYYTEDRLIEIRGKNSSDAFYVARFKGSDIRNQVNVSVTAASVEPRTRQSMEQKIYAMVDRQMIDPQRAARAIEGGYAESLVRDYELDVDKQRREIESMIALGDESMPGGDVPIAATFDDHEAHLHELHQFMKTPYYESLPAPVQEAMTAHAEQHEQLLQEKAIEAAQMQVEQAQSLGMANAARSTSAGMPSMPAPSGAQPSPEPPMPA